MEIADYVLSDEVLDSIWQEHRGRCYDDKLTFPQFVGLMRDALVHDGGSAHHLSVGLETRQAPPVDESHFYRKLAHMPVELSRALLRRTTTRMAGLLPGGVGVALPACFDRYTVLMQFAYWLGAVQPDAGGEGLCRRPRRCAGRRGVDVLSVS